MELAALFPEHCDSLEDFWDRRANRPRFLREFHLFGQPFRLSSNQEAVLRAIDHCLPLYSRAPATGDAPFSIQLVVQPGPADPVALPNNLFDHIQYTGDAEWLMIRLGAWGHCHVDLASGAAVAVLTPVLAARPDLVSLCLLNTIITNLFIAHGFAMLHASCLVEDGRALLLMAPHNSGKSTTALRLALSGYTLLSDSMIFLSPHYDEVQLLGFPVGKIKLRPDVLPLFPELRPLLATEYVRGERKYSMDLRQLDPEMVYQDAFPPSCTDLCLLERSDDTCLRAASRSEVMRAVLANSLFYDTDTVWQKNLSSIDALMAQARFHHLSIGADQAEIVTAVDSLWETRVR